MTNFNIITREQVISRFPAHKEQLEGAESCSDCHEQKTPPPEKLTLQVPYFSHQLHIEKKAVCPDCHPKKTENFKPNEKNCERCHAGQHDITGTKCTNCHVSGAEIMPHSGNWLAKHGKNPGIKEELCIDCHENNPKIKACSACHDRKTLTPAVHKDKNNYLYTHKLDARKKTIDCYACHAPETFCAPCHADHQRLPQDHFKPGFAFNHGRKAKRDPENCAACHSGGETCFRCHPGGINKK